LWIEKKKPIDWATTNKQEKKKEKNTWKWNKILSMSVVERRFWFFTTSDLTRQRCVSHKMRDNSYNTREFRERHLIL
jgi:hypothetical protein